MPTVYLSLGSNLGDRAGNLADALRRLDGPGLRLTAVSPIYETEPVGDTPEPVPAYLNCAARGETDLPPLRLLEYTQSVESEGGRERMYRWSPRSIDVDIVLYDGLVLADPRLTLPHPRAAERAFVLRTLVDVEPGLVFPDGRTAADLLRREPAASQALTRWGAAPLTRG